MNAFLLLLTLLVNQFALFAPTRVEITDLGVNYQFGQQAVFRARVTPTASVRHVNLFLQSNGSDTQVQAVNLNERGEINYTADLQSRPLRPFARVTYWYQVTTGAGDKIESDHFSFLYDDNRFKWQSLSNENVVVYWAEGDLAFGQAAVDVAEAGRKAVSNLLPGSLPAPLKIYIYPSSSELQNALQLGQLTWVAGHASPDLGVMLVSIPLGPEQRIEMERQIPHEMMHVLLYQVVGPGYSRLPMWYSEGMASLAEIYPNPDYERALMTSAESGRLLKMETLCNNFPREASSAFLAYAESASFVRLLYQKFGASGLQSLATQYRDGKGCAEAVSSALDTSLAELETTWRQESLGLDAGLLALRNLAPYLLILLILLVPPLVIGIAQRRRPAAVPKGGS